MLWEAETLRYTYLEVGCEDTHRKSITCLLAGLLGVPMPPAAKDFYMSPPTYIMQTQSKHLIRINHLNCSDSWDPQNDSSNLSFLVLPAALLIDPPWPGWPFDWELVGCCVKQDTRYTWQDSYDLMNRLLVSFFNEEGYGLYNLGTGTRCPNAKEGRVPLSDDAKWIWQEHCI